VVRFDAHLPIFAEQFTSPSVGGLNQDGYSDWFNFSTGRKGVASLHTVFTMRPRHDLLQYLYQFLRPLVDLETRYKDEILLDFTLAPGTTVPDGVWAVVAKDELLYVRQDRWDLVSAPFALVPVIFKTENTLIHRLSPAWRRTRACLRP
jgi:hypothetical protein